VPAVPTKRAFGTGFTDYDLLLDGDAEEVCDGCARMLRGQPGSDPPPLRLSSFVVVGGELHRVGIDDLVAVLREPPGDIEVVGWAKTRKKHASLRCGVCSPSRLAVGCDDGTIIWRPSKDATLLDAVAALRCVASREEILTGEYRPRSVRALGDAWREHERVIACYRPSLALEMAVAVVRRPENADTQEVEMELPREYHDAAALLGPLASASAWRAQDPIRFWNEFLPRRLDAASTCGSLAEWTGYVMQALDVDSSLPWVTDAVTADIEDEAAVLRVLRSDYRLVIALVQARNRRRHEAKDADPQAEIPF